jgi:hypothetical protein
MQLFFQIPTQALSNEIALIVPRHLHKIKPLSDTVKLHTSKRERSRTEGV